MGFDLKSMSVVGTYLFNGVKYTLHAVRMTTAHMYLKPGNRNRHNYHECVLDPWVVKAFPMFPQKNPYRRQK